MFGTLINAAKQVRDGTIGQAKLDTALQAEINQITVNKGDIAAIIASKAAANGIATLDAGGKLLSSQIPAIAVSDFLGEAADEAGMLALTGQKGDWMTRTDENQSYMIIDGDGSQLAHWREISTPLDGVTSLRNSSGSVTGLNGVVTLADVAFSGQAADVAFSHADFAANDVDGALVEVMGKAKTNEQNVTNLTTEMAGKLDAAKVKRGINMTGAIDGTNKTYAVPEAFVAGSLQAYFGGQRLREGVDYTIAGNDVTFIASPDFETERPFCDYVAAA